MTAFDLAQRFVGIKEIGGSADHPIISFALSLCGYSLDAPDEIPWCSAFVNFIAWLMRLPRSKSAAARSNLLVGRPIALADAVVGFDVVVLKRGGGNQPGPDVTSGAPGHVGFYAGVEGDFVIVLGGNQGNSVSLQSFPIRDVLGIRRLA